MSITAGAGNVVVNFKFNRLNGFRLVGGYLVRFCIDYSMPAWPEKNFRLTNIQAHISVGKEPRLLGRAFAESAVVLASTPYHQDNTLYLDLILSPRQLEAIEETRQGNGLDFKLQIFGELFDGLSYNNTSDIVHAVVNQTSWIELLKELEFSNTVLLELEVAGLSEQNGPAWKALRKAKEHLYNGHYDDVVASCRKALEGITHDKEELTRIRNIPLNERRKMSKRDRLINLLDALEHFTHPAHHLESSENSESYSRDESIFAFGATLAAVSIFSVRK